MPPRGPESAPEAPGGSRTGAGAFPAILELQKHREHGDLAKSRNIYLRLWRTLRRPRVEGNRLPVASRCNGNGTVKIPLVVQRAARIRLQWASG